MNKVCSFFMVIGLSAALHVNAPGGGFFRNLKKTAGQQDLH